MKAEVTRKKSFDKSTEFKKQWEEKDMETFLKEEGKYIDELAKILNEKGKAGNSFTVQYIITISK